MTPRLVWRNSIPTLGRTCRWRRSPTAASALDIADAPFRPLFPCFRMASDSHTNSLSAMKLKVAKYTLITDSRLFVREPFIFTQLFRFFTRLYNLMCFFLLLFFKFVYTWVNEFDSWAMSESFAGMPKIKLVFHGSQFANRKLQSLLLSFELYILKNLVDQSSDRSFVIPDEHTHGLNFTQLS